MYEIFRKLAGSDSSTSSCVPQAGTKLDRPGGTRRPWSVRSLASPGGHSRNGGGR